MEEKTVDYEFSMSDFETVKIDLTFIEASSYKEKTSDVVDWVRQEIANNPSAKPVILIMKRFLFEYGLSSSYNGGLSSFSCILMVLAFLKANRGKCVGNDFISFLEFYMNFDEEHVFIQSDLLVNKKGHFNLVEITKVLLLFIIL